jgi:DNA-binding NarL/FixJ family response regulator
MGTSLTRDEQLVLQLLVSGKGSEEIAAALDMPLEVVRTCTHALITRVLDEKQVPLRPHRLSHKEAAV